MKKIPQIAEYIWLSPGGLLRGKTRILQTPVMKPQDLPLWNFDGSSTRQAAGKFSDVTLKPVRVYSDPFRSKDDIIVLCECFDDGKLEKTNSFNTRSKLVKAVEGKEDLEMWTGIEQEYTLFDTKTRLPHLWKEHQNPGIGPQGPYYCGVGGDRAFGREIVEIHMNHCLSMGIAFGGINAEVMASQWEFQVGTGELLKIADDLITARYVLERITEKYGVYVNYHPRPHPGDWNGSGGHVNFSTKKMRAEGGLEEIKKAIKKLGLTHVTDLDNYGEHNHERLTGKHETASMHSFSWGVGDRGASIRINKAVAEQGKGYFEDRRPASNLDPYLVLSSIVNSIFH